MTPNDLPHAWLALALPLTPLCLVAVWAAGGWPALCALLLLLGPVVAMQTKL